MKSPEECFHLSVGMVERIHDASINRFGGSSELKSRELLESAVSAPQAVSEGKSVFSDLVDVAAASLYYLCSNHPFVDGNMRTALGACIVFLKLNGASPTPDSEEWEILVLEVANGRLSREQTTARLRKLVKS